MEKTTIYAKPWWLSRGIWGPIIAMASLVAQAVGSQFDVSLFIESGLEFLTLLGLGLGWWGRVEAQIPIDKRAILPGVSM